MSLLQSINKNLKLFLAFSLCACFIFSIVSAAEIRKVYLSENASEFTLLQLVKGADINLVNLDQKILRDLSLVNIGQGRKILEIDELPVGQSVQIGFDKVGSYVLIYKFNSQKLTNVYKRLLIEVVNANSA